MCYLVCDSDHLVPTSPKLKQNSKIVKAEAKRTEFFSEQKKEMSYMAVLIVQPYSFSVGFSETLHVYF